ncbi:VWA domain-containing protein [Paenibacillus sp. FJAT-27812]|uniref:VWA domain-containing protein n=1 Tax=Paenibacillus sp. FJAT-27812 TaxID=1684143 RepID=UPI000ADA1BFE
MLKQLDTMEGRIVDNANFVHIDDIAAISDERLYDWLLNEFPSWLKAAKEKRIIRPS